MIEEMGGSRVPLWILPFISEIKTFSVKNQTGFAYVQSLLTYWTLHLSVKTATDNM